MEFVQVPSPMRLLCGSALAYWLAGIINPAFVAIAVMIVLFIPVFVTDYFFRAQPDMDQQSNQSDYPDHDPIDNPTSQRLRNEDQLSKGR